jgi:hypothetical protein
MTSTIFYDNVNEIALISNTFTSAGNPADPTAVSCIITDPSGTAVTHTYAGAAPADIVKVSPGKYTLAVPCSPAVAGADGLWGYEWIGTGAVSDVQPGTWRVLPPNISQSWYIGLEEFKDRLGITDTADDFQAQIAIGSASQAINEHCGRHFNRITETRTYQPHNIWLLDIDDAVPGSAITVNLDLQGNGVYSTPLVQNVDYILRYGNNLFNQNVLGIARPYRQLQIIQTGNWLPFTWPFARLDRVQINTTWGWSQVPSPVVQGTFLLAADLFKLKDAPWGVAGMTDFGVVRIRENPMLNRMLHTFVNPRHRVGV